MTATDIFNNIKDKVSTLIANAKAQLDGKTPTLEQIWTAVQEFLYEIIKEIQIQAGNSAGVDKKEAAKQSAILFFNAVILPNLTVAFLPTFMGQYVLKYSQPIFLLLIAGTVNAIVTILQENNIPGFQKT